MGILDGKVAIVTGAGRGIGAEIARRFGAAGAAVAVAARTAEAGSYPLAGTITETAGQIRAAGGTARQTRRYRLRNVQGHAGAVLLRPGR
ncbi:MAG TPA: SDR family NAD(P)-dependent oxidoreductase [Streptosporangiaceae bacterium]